MSNFAFEIVLTMSKFKTNKLSNISSPVRKPSPNSSQVHIS